MLRSEGHKWVYRAVPVAEDAERIRGVIESTEFFRPDEVGVAVSLVEERLEQGEPSGYFFVFAGEGDKVAGYTCFGPIPCTLSSYDLYWIAVERDCQGSGLGRALIAKTEEAIRQQGGTRVYIETSSKPLYEPTRQFYLRCGYSQVAFLEDFYGPDDSKVVYAKVL